MRRLRHKSFSILKVSGWKKSIRLGKIALREATWINTSPFCLPPSPLQTLEARLYCCSRIIISQQSSETQGLNLWRAVSGLLLDFQQTLLQILPTFFWLESVKIHTMTYYPKVMWKNKENTSKATDPYRCALLLQQERKFELNSLLF